MCLYILVYEHLPGMAVLVLIPAVTANGHNHTT